MTKLNFFLFLTFKKLLGMHWYHVKATVNQGAKLWRRIKYILFYFNKIICREWARNCFRYSKFKWIMLEYVCNILQKQQILNESFCKCKLKENAKKRDQHMLIEVSTLRSFSVIQFLNWMIKELKWNKKSTLKTQRAKRATSAIWCKTFVAVH